MTSEVEICNIALSHIRAGSINSLNEASVQAQYCKLHYPILRDQMLEDSPWGFANSIKPLAVLTSEVFNWRYTYQYPPDCLYINKLIMNYATIDHSNTSTGVAYRYLDRGLPKPDLDRQVEHKILNIGDNKVIVANLKDLRIDYRKRIIDPNLFSNNFKLALSHLLAANLAIAIMDVEKGRALKSDNLRIYQNYLNAGIQNQSNEQYQIVPDSDFVTVR